MVQEDRLGKYDKRHVEVGNGTQTGLIWANLMLLTFAAYSPNNPDKRTPVPSPTAHEGVTWLSYDA